MEDAMDRAFSDILVLTTSLLGSAGSVTILLAQVAFDHSPRLRATDLLLLSRDTLIHMQPESKSLTHGRFCKRR